MSLKPIIVQKILLYFKKMKKKKIALIGGIGLFVASFVTSCYMYRSLRKMFNGFEIDLEGIND